MKRFALVCCLTVLAASGCTDSITEPDSPPAAAASPLLEAQWVTHTSDGLLAPIPTGSADAFESARSSLEAPVLTVAELEELVEGLFPAPGLSRAALVQLRNIHRDLERGNDEDALLKAQDFRDFTLQRLETGQLEDPNGTAPPTIEQAVATLLNDVLEAVGLPGGQVVGLSRITYGSGLIDGVDPGDFPRGGFYTATIAGDGVEEATGIVIENPDVFGFVMGSPGPDLLTVRIWSTLVERDRPDLAEILDVPFEVTTDLGGGAALAIGSGVLDIVPGPAPVASNLRIVGPATELPRGQSTAIDFAVDIATAGNLRFYFVGCAICRVEFTGVTGDQFETVLTVTITWDVPADFPFPDLGVGIGAVSGADLGGGASLSIPVVDP